MDLLITGGAGYIGSHMVRLLVRQGFTPIVIDTGEIGHPESLPPEVKLVRANVSDSDQLTSLFSQHKFTGVIHFAGYTQVAESVTNPQKYFTNNLVSPAALLQTMVSHDVKCLIFSSTAAVYGEPQSSPIPETHPTLPTNPYGLSKLYFEQLLSYYDRVYGLRSISLRYFNAAGAAQGGSHGEAHSPETHIIPLALHSALGLRPDFTLFGTDFPTPDGTCVRDYIHIEDLCRAHLLCLDALRNGHPTDIYNVGTGTGHSNKEVVEVVKRVTGKDFPVKFGNRRPGDPAILVADSSHLQSEFTWKPQSSDLETIIKTAWSWHSSHPKGYTP